MKCSFAVFTRTHARTFTYLNVLIKIAKEDETSLLEYLGITRLEPSGHKSSYLFRSRRRPCSGRAFIFQIRTIGWPTRYRTTPTRLSFTYGFREFVRIVDIFPRLAGGFGRVQFIYVRLLTSIELTRNVIRAHKHINYLIKRDER